MSVAREKLLERIRALKDKTVGRGCTEEEALAAAAKAAELMGKHGLSDEDLVIEEAASILAGKRHSSLMRLWATIGYVTNTAALRVNRGRADGILFIGQAPGPDIAVYLRDVCDRAVARQLVAFKASTFYRRRRNLTTKRAAVADFLGGLVNRLCWRLVEIFGPSHSEEAAGRALAARDARYATSEIDIKDREPRFSDAEWAGSAAGDRVNLSHGVGGKTAALLQLGRQ